MIVTQDGDALVVLWLLVAAVVAVGDGESTLVRRVELIELDMLDTGR